MYLVRLIFDFRKRSMRPLGFGFLPNREPILVYCSRVHCARGAEHVHQLLGFHHRHEPDVCTKRQDSGVATRIWKKRRNSLSNFFGPKSLFRAPNVKGNDNI
jgi:hypothetical protein